LNYVFLFVRIGNSNPDSSSKIGNGAWIQRNEIEMASSEYPSIHWYIIPSIKWPFRGVITTFSGTDTLKSMVLFSTPWTSFADHEASPGNPGTKSPFSDPGNINDKWWMFQSC